MSWQMHVVAGFLRVAYKGRFASRERAARRMARPKDRPMPTKRVAAAGGLSRRRVRGHDVWTVTPSTQRTAGTLVYLHGGAYVSAIAPQHWDLIAELVEEVGCHAVVPLYGLTPEFEATEAVEFVSEVLAEIDGPIYLMGDSAGGGLALAVAEAAVAAGRPMPTGLTLIAPWLDIAIRNPAIREVEKVDPWLSSEGLHLVGETWSRGVSPDDPRVSPLFGDLEHLPPIDLHVGTRDITLPDSRLLAERIGAFGPDRITLLEVEGALHVYPLLPVPEAKPARAHMVGTVRSALGG